MTATRHRAMKHPLTDRPPADPVAHGDELRRRAFALYGARGFNRSVANALGISASYVSRLFGGCKGRAADHKRSKIEQFLSQAETEYAKK